ncbi:hypothetical protein J4E83_003832 [Alternaria metachromatica]|uniref:uncharacterized protein n=1 Tax=Alternaria metachromatica TaxID=283354 RepID=UPI0020C21273|nr:uncharacterized protein J4E83_003832 [Alternaria metachromatica]KAI4626680.1 hypothetical protein J4E83_003832 [Alternaria metachromatica]
MKHLGLPQTRHPLFLRSQPRKHPKPLSRITRTRHSILSCPTFEGDVLRLKKKNQKLRANIETHKNNIKAINDGMPNKKTPNKILQKVKKLANCVERQNARKVNTHQKLITTSLANDRQLTSQAMLEVLENDVEACDVDFQATAGPLWTELGELCKAAEKNDKAATEIGFRQLFPRFPSWQLTYRLRRQLPQPLAHQVKRIRIDYRELWAAFIQHSY